MNIFLLYQTDEHHSHNSKVLIGIASSLSNACTLAHAAAQDEDIDLASDEHQWNLLHSIKQTQGYQGHGEFLIEEHTLDTLI